MVRPTHTHVNATRVRDFHILEFSLVMKESTSELLKFKLHLMKWVSCLQELSFISTNNVNISGTRGAPRMVEFSELAEFA